MEGGGTFAFIPDAVIVGTTFVNCVANVLSTFSQSATLSLTAPAGVRFGLRPAGGQQQGVVVREESWGWQVELGPLQVGDLCCRGSRG
jgi:hypothetical protein